MAITFQPITAPTPTQLETIVDDLLQGSGVTLVAGTVVYAGANGQGSTFTDGTAAVGIASGLLLTSGNGSPAITNTEDAFSLNLSRPGDADLSLASEGLLTNDANTLSFQVLVSDPSVTSLTFTFVFASEEYPEFVDEYADIAVIMSNGMNRATFANSEPLTVTSNNLSFFRRNTSDLLPDNTPPPGPIVNLPIEYDGVSIVFTINVPVTLGVNTIKFGVSDTTDANLDSALFIGSIVAGSGTPGPIVTGPSLPSLSIAPATLTLAEGNVGAQTFNYTVTRTGDTTGTSSVAWSLAGSGGNPANASDFVGGVLPSGSLTFNPGETSRVIQIPVNGDFAVETNETFTVTLSAPVNASLGLSSASGTITNDDTGGPTTLNIGPAALSLVEGDSGVQVYTYTVTRTGTVSAESTVNWVVDGFGSNPASGADFQGGVLPGGLLTFAIGETSKTIEIRVTGDLAFESDEQFRVSLTTPTGAAIGVSNQAIGTIVNDDDPAPQPIISPPAQVLVEGGVGQTTVFTYTVTRFGDLSQAVSGSWVITTPETGPAANEADFLAMNGLVNFAPGVATAQVQVTVIGDATPESSEAFGVFVSLPGFDPLGAQGVIVNDDVVTTAAMGDAGDDVMAFAAGPTVAYGLSGADWITGGGFADALNGGDGRDWLRSMGGDDVLVGGAGNDLIDGGAGFDIAAFGGAASDYAWWSNTDGSWTVRDLRAGGLDGIDLLYAVERLQFSDRAIDIAGLTNGQILGNAFENVLRRGPASSQDQAFLADLNGRVAGGQWSMAQALDAIIDAADATTAVAVLSYQLFLGYAPEKGGIDYLVAQGGGNANNLNSDYYAAFGMENRYINFAVNLGAGGEGRIGFEAAYGGLSLAETFDAAYARIFGQAAGAGQAASILDGIVSTGQGDITRADYFATYGGDALGTKAAMVGWLLAEAVKADLGPYAQAAEAYLLDLADGAPFRVNIVGVYGPDGLDGI